MTKPPTSPTSLLPTACKTSEWTLYLLLKVLSTKNATPILIETRLWVFSIRPIPLTTMPPCLTPWTLSGSTRPSKWETVRPTILWPDLDSSLQRAWAALLTIWTTSTPKVSPTSLMALSSRELLNFLLRTLNLSYPTNWHPGPWLLTTLLITLLVPATLRLLLTPPSKPNSFVNNTTSLPA